jgi:hypothetical protein
VLYQVITCFPPQSNGTSETERRRFGQLQGRNTHAETEQITFLASDVDCHNGTYRSSQ